MENEFYNILKKDYRLVKLLHKSDKGKCVLYRHRQLEKNIVIHILNNASTDVYSVLKRIRHRNITEVFEVLEINGQTVIIEEYINGITLAEISETMSPIGVKRILLQLCDGLSALHSVGIVYRDITLNNIMLTNDGIVKIIDFDIAKLFKSSDTIDNNTMGTMGYAPFEQFGLNRTDEHSDIFAVGVIANLLLTGKHPSVKIFTKGRLGKFIRICTNINQYERFDSADDILNFLKQYI
ncbi:MAG: serine/threonine protein kinase [Ruminococcus sp.]|nr:serine/threonine protein kinase [Ruminococcus sp.]